MHKEVPTTRASRFNYVVTGAFLFLGFIYFVFLNARTTSATLKVLGFGTNQCGDFVLLQLRNAGPKTIFYEGLETNEPSVTLEFQTSAGRRALSRGSYSESYHRVTPYDVELQPHQSVEFRVLTSDMQQNFQVALTYWVPGSPGPLDWLRRHLPYQISDWLFSSHRRKALTPLITTNSQLASAN